MTIPNPIRQVPFRNPKWPRLGLEVLWLSRMGRNSRPPRPERRDCHLLLLCTAGSGKLLLDFTPLELGRGMVAHIRPGQVIQRPAQGNLEARVALFRPEFPDPEAGALELQICQTLDPRTFRAAERAFSELQEECAQTDGTPEGTGLLRNLLGVLLHRLGHGTGSQAPNSAQEELLREFQQELELSYQVSRKVAHYARRLGYAEKTLNRALHRLDGSSAKAMIDGRVLLEAKRLLVHTREPIGTIARQLGFSEPTNFAKFFRKGAGCGPTEFRKRMMA